jgi:hypothetical protein
MRTRWWIHLLAVIGVLLHAGALARHNGIMLGATLQGDALAADLSVICHGAGVTKTSAADLPSAPQPSDPQNTCPICLGLAPAVALTGTGAILVGGPAPQAIPVAAGHEPVSQLSHAVCPPARGPPAFA